MIENLGLPVFSIIGLAWYVSKIHKETLELQITQNERSDRAIKEAQESNKELMYSNKELLETNRTLAESINTKLDNIENNVIEIKKDIEKR